MFLFRRRTEILGDDRSSCCRVLEDSAYLIAIARREIALMVEVEAEIQPLPREVAMQKTLASRQRMCWIASWLSDTFHQQFLVFSAEDKNHQLCLTIPSAATPLLKELRSALEYLLRGAENSYTRLESLANQGIPFVLRNWEAQRFLRKSDTHAAEARRELGKLASRLRLTEEERSDINSSAEQRADLVKWP